MACIPTYPSCNFDNEISSPLGKFGALVGIVGGVGSAAGAIVKLAGLGALGGGILAAVVAAVAVIILIAWYADNRCSEADGRTNCIAGCISDVRASFSETYETIFPFAGMPNRVDVTVKSHFWGALEQGNAYVYCNDEAYPRTSEIIHTYYYTKKLCAAETGALVGAGIGAAAGVIAAVAATVAIGCATIFLCILALLIAIIIVIAAALLGAFAGGNAGRAIADENEPTGTGPLNQPEPIVLKVGQFVTQTGNMIKSGEDNSANVLWWVNSTTVHGEAAPGTPQPFCYCEIDEQFQMDSCQRPPVVIP